MGIIESTAEISAKPKKIVDRSAAYPSISIEEAIGFSRDVAKNFPKDGLVITRTDIAAVLKTSAPTIQRDVSSCAQYGLFNKQEGGYTIAPLVKLVAHPIEKEKRKNIIECFRNPKLYKSLIEVYDGHAVPSELAYFLSKDYDISEKAAPDAAEIFFANAKFCGVISDSNILFVADALERLNGNSVQFAEVYTEKNEPLNPVQNQVIDLTPRSDSQQLLPPKVEIGEERVPIRLSGKKYAYLLYPEGITKRDIDIIRKQLDVIEFQISDE